MLHHPVSTETISRWLKAMLKSCGVNIIQYKAHSTRSAYTSTVYSTGMSVQAIMKAAGWSSECNFIDTIARRLKMKIWEKFYNLFTKVMTMLYNA